MKNIAFAKIGKSIKFKTSYSPIGGDNEAPNILVSLANNNPDKTFYIVGRSDFSKLNEFERISLFPYDNVIDCMKGETNASIMKDPYILINYLKDKNVDIDFGVMMIGQIGTVTIPNRVNQIKRPELKASVIDMVKGYCTPVINWLNETNIPWVQLINDPRYTHNQSRDFVSSPLLTLSQYDYTYIHNRINSFDDQTRIKEVISCSYSGIETAYCVGKTYPNIKNYVKDQVFSIILNEGDPSRFNELKRWVLDYNDDVSVYGKWSDEVMLDSRFKGPLKLDKIESITKRSKYTFIIPIKKGWVTSKYIEMIHAGCIPFFHPTYDEQGHTGVPDILRVTTPEELYNRIDYFESRPEERIELLSKLQTLLKPEYYTGEYINHVIMDSMYKSLGLTYIPPNITSFNKKTINTLF